MATLTSTQTVAEVVSANPSLSVIFEKYGIDYCCGGKLPIEEACRNAGLITAEVLAALTAAAARPVPGETDWAKASLEALILNILNVHHEPLRVDIPRLSSMLAKVVRVHGGHHPELARIQEVFGELCAELQSHMVKEEQILFPAIVRLEREHAAQTANPWLNNPIRVMEHEHAAVGAMLATLKQLTSGYAAPGDACNTFRVLYDGMQKMETDLHLHIHKENNILFPRAQALELEATGAAAR